MPSEYTLEIGLDWADQKHDLAVSSDGGASVVYFEIASSPHAIDHWIMEQRHHHRRGRFAVCLEQKRGALLYALMKYDFVDLFPANPAMGAKYRQAFASSGAKNDPGDAGLMLELLVKHRDRLRLLEPDRPEIRKLTLLCEARRKQVDERTRLSNRMQSLLKDYFPQALPLCGEKLYCPMALDFFERWQRFEALARTREKTIVEFFKKRRGSKRRIQAALEAKRESCPVTDDPAIVETSMLVLRGLVAQIRVVQEAVARLEEEIEKVASQAEDYHIFTSLPRAGKALAPRLLCAFGGDRSRWQDARDIQTLGGVAPVTAESGKSRWVHWRWNCPKFLRQTLVEYAHESCKGSVWAKAFYEHQRGKGKGNNAALRALAYKWVRIIYRCWMDREPYEEQRYLNALREHGSWLAECDAA